MATAGPGAGCSSVFLRSGDKRVRLAINDSSPLCIMPEDEHVVVVKGEEVIARGVAKVCIRLSAGERVRRAAEIVKQLTREYDLPIGVPHCIPQRPHPKNFIRQAHAR